MREGVYLLVGKEREKRGFIAGKKKRDERGVTPGRARGK